MLLFLFYKCRFQLQMVASRYALRIVWLKQLLGHVDFDTRESIARLLGMSSCALPLSALSDLITELISSLAGSKLRSVFQISSDFIALEFTSSVFLCWISS